MLLGFAHARPASSIVTPDPADRPNSHGWRTRGRSLALALALPALVASLQGCYENFGPNFPITPAGDRNIEAGPLAQDSQGVLHALYTGEVGNETWIAIRHSTDGGQSWPTFDLVHNLEDHSFRNPDATSAKPVALLCDQTAAREDWLYVLFSTQGNDDEIEHLYYVRSADGGATWSAPYPMSFGGGFFEGRGVTRAKFAQNPQTGSLVVGYMTFDEDDPGKSTIKFRRSTHTTFFSEPTTLPAPETFQWLIDMEFAVDGRLVVATGRGDNDGDTHDTYIDISADDGRTWTERGNPYPLAQWEFTHFQGDLLSTGSEMHFVLNRDHFPEDEFVYASSSDLGANWTDFETILSYHQPYDSDEGVYATDPYLTDLGGGLLLSFTRQVFTPTERTDLYTIRYFEGWEDRMHRVNNWLGEVSSYRGGIALTVEGNLAAVWGDTRWNDDEGGNAELTAALSDPNDGKDIGVELDELAAFDQVRRRQSIAFDYTVGSWRDEPQTFDVWATYRGENGIQGTLIVHRDVTAAPNSEVDLRFSGKVGARAPFQDYDVTVFAGEHPNVVYDSDTFTAVVVP